VKDLLHGVLDGISAVVPEALKRQVRGAYLKHIYGPLFPPRPVPRREGTWHWEAGEVLRPTIVCLPVIDWSFRFQRPQQLLTRLAARGYRVLYIEPRLDGVPSAFKGEFLDRWTWPITANVLGVKLPTKLDRDIYASELDESDVRALLTDFDAIALGLGVGDVTVLVQLPFWAPFARALAHERGGALVYDCMDDHGAFANTSAAMLAHEQRLVAEADLVLVSSKALEEKHAAARKLLRVPNGCDFAHFEAAPLDDELAALPRPIVGYFGAIAEWFAPELVAAAARARPDASFVLVGRASAENRRALEPLANVHFLGEKDYAVLPRYLAGFDVCLIPFQRTPLTLATNPVKVFEYLSAGKPVVSATLPELVPFSEVVRFADAPQDFARAVSEALAAPQDAERRRAVARANGWEARAADFDQALHASRPNASIVLVTWNQWEFTNACLESLFRFLPPSRAEVIVVDNASRDGTRTGLYGWACQHPSLRVIYNDANRGFAAANNQGLRIAKGDLLVLLNNDTIVPPGWLHGLARHLEDPEVGLVGPVTNNIGNEARIETSYEDLAGMIATARRVRREGAGKVFDIASLAMYCVAMRREVFERVGELDERFGIGMFEDDDYARRVRQIGKRVVCAEDVFVHHFGGASFKTLKQPQYDANFARNRALFESKWGEPWVPHKYRPS
jgi:GT2 family glycosyltransferase/glycosyltransferase involved in cell wall biosynthesis